MLNLRLNYPSVHTEMDVFQRYVAGLPEERKYHLLQPPNPPPPAATADVVAQWLQLPADTWRNTSTMMAIASGNSGLYTVLSWFQSVSKEIATDAYTFTGFRMIANTFGFPLIPIAGDEEGMLPAALEAYLQQRSTVPGTKLVYLQPTVHNPTCAVMSLERRQAIAEVLLRFPDTYILEDDAYRFLHPAPPPTFLQLLPERTVHVYSLSKNFNPFLKAAYLVYPKHIMDNIENMVRLTTSSTCALFQDFAVHLMQGEELKQIIQQKQAEGLYWYKKAAEIFYDQEFTLFPGSFHIWLHVGAHLTGQQVADYCLTQDIAVQPGVEFSVTGDDQYVRIALGAEWANPKLQSALELIAAVVRAGKIPA
ncbi:hypothetical protein DCC81_00280 [Chitinophaga parva]|uniref:Aminotransferase class I/classII large domain-containing protein n=1 Tax=Chitinophaga parva TaxID=2169414 RepID=A0A2T7BJW2_9BACT|nr:PLP-dependent aminotransferase family protein [Chitinophaga parva]PUZ27964.1 hypothetical protein DCC81_00280 [Chitinophaga parva]